MSGRMTLEQAEAAGARVSGDRLAAAGMASLFETRR
jgi:hypothetical protein